jgi:hypothetical protein
MIACVLSVLLLTKSWTYTCIFPPMKHVLFYLLLLEGVVRITFEELDSIELAWMWRGPSESRRDMMYIIFMLYLLMCRLEYCCW